MILSLYVYVSSCLFVCLCLPVCHCWRHTAFSQSWASIPLTIFTQGVCPNVYLSVCFYVCDPIRHKRLVYLPITDKTTPSMHMYVHYLRVKSLNVTLRNDDDDNDDDGDAVSCLSLSTSAGILHTNTQIHKHTSTLCPEKRATLFSTAIHAFLFRFFEKFCTLETFYILTGFYQKLSSWNSLYLILTCKLELNCRDSYDVSSQLWRHQAIK